MVVTWGLFCCVVFIGVLIGVSFFTLLERKVLALIQRREGPNITSIFGILQPLGDGLKLFSKETVQLRQGNQLPYRLAPGVGLGIALGLWQLYPSLRAPIFLKWGTLLFLSLNSLGVYPVFLAGWACNSKFSMLGCMRAVAQTVSYEAMYSLIILCVVAEYPRGCLQEIMGQSKWCWLGVAYPVLFVGWFCAAFAETNRAPFDFVEGESELVSGFNVEYRSAGFSLLFLAEYANIMIMRVLGVTMFLGGWWPLPALGVSLPLKATGICFIFVWARGTLPRYRYDLIIYIAWKCAVPLLLGVLLFFVAVKFLVIPGTSALMGLGVLF